MAVSSDVCWCRHVKQAHWGSGNCKHAYCGCEEYEPKDATRAASQERPRPDPEPCALWGVCVRPRGHDGPHTSTVEDAARLTSQERPQPGDGFDNTTEACRHCPTPDVHPTRIGGILTYEGRCDPDTCERHDHSEPLASQERPPIDVERQRIAGELRHYDLSDDPGYIRVPTERVRAILSGSVGE